MEFQGIPTALGVNDPDDGDIGRQLRGLAITAITKNKLGYSVVSQSGAGSYIVNVDDEPFCNCPDFEKRQQPCKHVYSVWCLIQREELPNGTVKETTQAVSVKYTQNWPAYDAAQMCEGDYFATLLRELCDTVPEKEYGFGRPCLPLSDVLYGVGVKVYSMKSGRRAMSDIRSAKAQGLLDKAPSFATVARYLANPDLTPLLQNLITLSSLPLKAVEVDFAVDSTGFGSGSYNYWHSEKWDTEVKRKKWVKAHVTSGVRTNIVVRADITVNPSGDSPFLIPHLNTVGEHFTVNEFSGDKAYLSKDNLLAIEKAGANPYVPFKKNSVPHLPIDEGDEVWNRLLAYFMFNRAEFNRSYHKRSNVESTIGAIKAKLGEKIRCKTDTAMVNEVLAKILCYNITVLIAEMFQLGITPEFDSLIPDRTPVLAGVTFDTDALLVIQN